MFSCPPNFRDKSTLTYLIYWYNFKVFFKNKCLTSILKSEPEYNAMNQPCNKNGMASKI